jgi:glycosyltransferase involved in cell wall biosynthesis
MADLDVIISSPFPIDSLQGNSVSARRIASRVTSTGLPAISAFRERHPTRPIVVVATGTDLYKDLPVGTPEPLEAMRLADAIVVYQEASASDVPDVYRSKVITIWKSVDLPMLDHPPAPPPRSPITFTVLAHLRDVKDPFLPVAALGSIGAGNDLRIDHFGAALDPELIAQAQEWMTREPRYHWWGQRPRDQVAEIIASSHATINSGRAEGGSNSVCESIVLGTPVLATAIPANIGFLGEDYLGYFPPGDVSALADLLTACADPDQSLLEALGAQVRQRAPRFHPESEATGWRSLLDTLVAGSFD